MEITHLERSSLYWDGALALAVSDRCICRLEGDPLIKSYDKQELLLTGTHKYTLTKDMVNASDPCSFNVEVKVTPLVRQQRVQYATTMPRFIDIDILGFSIHLGQNHKAFVSTGLILGLYPVNERRCYKVTPSLIGWVRTKNQPWSMRCDHLWIIATSQTGSKSPVCVCLFKCSILFRLTTHKTSNLLITGPLSEISHRPIYPPPPPPTTTTTTTTTTKGL